MTYPGLVYDDHGVELADVIVGQELAEDVDCGWGRRTGGDGGRSQTVEGTTAAGETSSSSIKAGHCYLLFDCGFALPVR